MTKYRKGPQKTHKGPTKEHYTGPQRIGNHEKTVILTTILCNFKIILFIFLEFLLFFCFFVNFGISMN